MKTTKTRLMSSMGLALCLGLTFMPTACGGGQEFTADHRSHRAEGQSVPGATVEALTACANQAAGGLTDTSYAIKFDVEVSRSGEARTAKVKDSSPSDRALEQCMARALEGMTLPRHMLMQRSSGRVSPESRGLNGDTTTLLLIGGFELGPVFIVVAGVTIIIVIAVAVTRDPMPPTDDDLVEKCMPFLNECLANPWQPSWNSDYGAKKDCKSCYNRCRNEKGVWPEKVCPHPGR